MCQTCVFASALIWGKKCGRGPFRNSWYEAPDSKWFDPNGLLICKFDEFGASKMAKFGASDHVYFDDWGREPVFPQNMSKVTWEYAEILGIAPFVQHFNLWFLLGDFILWFASQNSKFKPRKEQLENPIRGHYKDVKMLEEHVLCIRLDLEPEVKPIHFPCRVGYHLKFGWFFPISKWMEMVDFKAFETVCLKFPGRHDDLGPLRKKGFG